MQLFYCPELTPKTEHIYLSEQESKHCVRVLRMKIGDQINIIDGKGGFYKAEITNPNQKKCNVKILEYADEEKKPFYIHIGIAPTKNFDKIEWFIEKCVELGIDEISFIKSKHSERKIVKIERAFKTALTASKQSLKSKIPIINDLVSFDQFIQNNTDKDKYIAYVKTGSESLLKQAVTQHSKYCVLIGPEGGFNKEEVEFAKTNGFTPVSLGKSRLRTETAGIIACHILNLFGE